VENDLRLTYHTQEELTPEKLEKELFPEKVSKQKASSGGNSECTDERTQFVRLADFSLGAKVVSVKGIKRKRSLLQRRECESLRIHHFSARGNVLQFDGCRSA